MCGDSNVNIHIHVLLLFVSRPTNYTVHSGIWLAGIVTKVGIRVKSGYTSQPQSITPLFLSSLNLRRTVYTVYPLRMYNTQVPRPAQKITLQVSKRLEDHIPAGHHRMENKDKARLKCWPAPGPVLNQHVMGDN